MFVHQVEQSCGVFGRPLSNRRWDVHERGTNYCWCETSASCELRAQSNWRTMLRWQAYSVIVTYHDQARWQRGAIITQSLCPAVLVPARPIPSQQTGALQQRFDPVCPSLCCDHRNKIKLKIASC